MADTTKPENVAIEPYRLGEFATGGKIDFITQGNVSIPLSIELLKGIVPVKQNDREPYVVELVMFANTVIEQKCNCYLNECWLVMIRGKYVPIIAAQKRIAKAQSLPNYDGYEWGWIDKEGNRCPSGPGQKVLETNVAGVWGRIYFKDRQQPFYHEVFRSEYQHQKNDRPITMLLKTTRDQLHKYAFANEMGNLCTENELYDERLPAPESDVKPRDERRAKAVPSTTLTGERAPAQEAESTTTPAEAEAKTEAEPASDEDKKTEDSAAESSVFTTEEKGKLAALFVEVNDLYAAQNGSDFGEFAAYVLCVDEEEVDQPSKFTEEQLKQIKAYIETNGVAIN